MRERSIVFFAATADCTSPRVICSHLTAAANRNSPNRVLHLVVQCVDLIHHLAHAFLLYPEVARPREQSASGKSQRGSVAKPAKHRAGQRRCWPTGLLTILLQPLRRTDLRGPHSRYTTARSRISSSPPATSSLRRPTSADREGKSAAQKEKARTARASSNSFGLGFRKFQFQ